MRKLAISLNKGGVGKSSSAVTIAHGLALEGKRVLLVDTDEQGHDGILLGANPELGLADVLSDEASIKDVLFEARQNLWLLKGDKSLSGVKRSISRKDYASEQTLSECLKPIEKDFDFVILDTSPSWDALTINALFYATEVLSPVSLEILTIKSLVEFINSIESVQKFNKNLKHKYVLPTFLDGRVKKSGEILKQLKKHFPDILLSPINYNVRLSECAGFGKTIFEFAPNSPGARDYAKVIKKILDEK